MLVYRFENSHGFGPYQGVGCLNDKQKLIRMKLINAHQDYEHPDVQQDTRWEFQSGDHYCACDALQSLLDWFEGYVKSLFDVGYVICCYNVPAEDVMYSKSGRQIGFAWRNAELVDRIKKCPNS